MEGRNKENAELAGGSTLGGAPVVNGFERDLLRRWIVCRVEVPVTGGCEGGKEREPARVRGFRRCAGKPAIE